jgi:hypothetical protein
LKTICAPLRTRRRAALRRSGSGLSIVRPVPEPGAFSSAGPQY